MSVSILTCDSAYLEKDTDPAQFEAGTVIRSANLYAQGAPQNSLSDVSQIVPICIGSGRHATALSSHNDNKSRLLLSLSISSSLSLSFFLGGGGGGRGVSILTTKLDGTHSD